MSIINLTNTGMAASVILTLIVIFMVSFVVSFLFWLIYHQNMKKG